MHFLKQSSAGLLAILGASCIQSTYANNHGSYNYDGVRNLARNPVVPRQSTQNFYPVTGPTSNGTLAVRQEIRELQKDSTLWTLYVLALDFMQYTNQTNMLSWYQISGIHGEPYAPWDNVQPGPGLGNSGYCHHVSILFPTWHRPYLALFEQLMYNLVQEIAAMWPAGPVQDQYVAAGKNFRIPYWDWAAVPSDGNGVLPHIVQDSPSMSVDGPAGTQMIANPLFTYQFKPVDPKAFIYAPYNEQNYVLRYPNNNTASAFSQNDLVARQLDNNAATFRSRLYNLFGAYHNYTTFSNTGWYPDNTDGDYDSIEGIHDQIHALVGSGGHMSVTDYSAFDPIFMLHHANIDRLFAMWQVINPESYVVPTAATADTYNFKAGDTLDSQSIFTPFRDTSGNFWNSDTARDTHTFGYTYPETNEGSDVDVKDQVLKAINALYGDKTTNGTDGDNPQKRDAIVNHREWIVNLKVDKHALNGSFFVHIFLGDFGSDPVGWSFEPNLVGTWAVLDKFNTANAPNKPVSGTIPLTGVLSKLILANKLQSLDPDIVQPCLIANLKYRITLLDDTEVGNGEVPSLSVMVISAPVVPPQTDLELPAWGATVVHMDITTTK
ncbi:Tyrosinase [Lachnellula occidentalis]|uniref:Tyrosinase n=1 Tax=Lachnellula occidentalis TaxID=215460 RepID=A0A8H8RSC4_9HELO|nr:Tyrosinase [Lachnellula occidentalis]